MASIYDFKAKTIDGVEQSLSDYRGKALLIVNVIGGYGLPGGVLAHLSQPQNAWLEELLTAHSAEVLTEARARALSRGVANVEIEAETGEVATALTRLAREKAIDAVVVGKRGAGGVEALLLGSVAHKLVSLAACPVIVVP